MAINATQVLIKINNRLLAGQIDFGISESTEIFEVSSKNTGNFSEFLAGRTSGTIGVTGLAGDRAESTKVGYYELRNARDTHQKVKIIIGSFTDKTGDVNIPDTETLTYNAFVSQLDVDFPDNETGTFSCTFQLSGAPEEFLTQNWYGVEWDINDSSPAVTRIAGSAANMTYHATLPVQNQMRACLMNDAGGVNYYLNPLDWRYKTDGTNAETDGSHGQVMIEIPSFFWKFETDGDIRRIKISPFEVPGFIHVQKMYIGAYEAALQRSTSKLASVRNFDVDYRGGDNTAAWDGQSNSLLGKPATNISLTDYRTYARNRGNGWESYFYLAHKVITWLFVVEYATRNTQAPVNSNLTIEGYRQGGLGDGVTTANITNWGNFNNRNPFINCGAGDSVLGSKTGEILEIVHDFEGAGTAGLFTVPRYRGIENPFGHTWKWPDGCKALIQSDADGGLSEFYTCDDPANFISSGVDNYELRGYLPRTNGFVKEVLFGEHGEIMSFVIGGGSTTYFCDYFYTYIPDSGTSERGVLFGGNASYGTRAGFVSANTYYTATSALASFGSRLCFYKPKF